MCLAGDERLWIVGDFEKIDWCIATVKIFLGAGLLILARAFLLSRGGIQNLLFRPIRRLRFMFHKEEKVESD